MQLYKFNTKTLTYEYAKRGRWQIFLLAAIVFTVLGFSSAVKVNSMVERIPVVLPPQTDLCTDDNVKACIKRLNLRFPKIVYQQAVVESNHYTSPLFKNLNNLVCMENARQRPTVGSDIGNRFARYDNWQESLVDYALWQAYYARDVDTEEDYYYLLDKVYCDGDLPENAGVSYSSRLKQVPWECQDP